MSTTITSEDIHILQDLKNNAGLPLDLLYPGQNGGRLARHNLVEYHLDLHNYVLTKNGYDYLHKLNNKVRDRDWQHMNAAEQTYLINYELNSDDIQTLLDIIDNARSMHVREDAFIKVRRSTPTQAMWNRFAHNKCKAVRAWAATKAAIEEYLDETDPTIISDIIRLRRDDIPHNIIIGWYRNHLTPSVRVMNASDIDMVVDDGQPNMIAELAKSKGDMLTREQIQRITDIARSNPESKDLKRAMHDIIEHSNHIPDDILEQYGESSVAWGRLYRYRAAYRALKDMECMFADKNGSFIREQQRLAIQEGQN